MSALRKNSSIKKMKPHNKCILFALLAHCLGQLNADTISRAGYYTLGYNITSTAGVAYTITGSNVILDLNNHVISGAGTGFRAASINNGMTNVTIKNGVTANMTGNTILINPGCSNVTISNITTFSSTGIINAAGIDANYIFNLTIDSCVLASCSTMGQLNMCPVVSCSTVKVTNMRMTNNFSGDQSKGCTFVNAYDITVDNVSMDGNNAVALSYPCYLQSCTGAVISNINFSNNTNNGVLAKSLLTTLSAYNVTINNYTVANNLDTAGFQAIAVQFGPCQNLFINNCSVIDNVVTNSFGGDTSLIAASGSFVINLQNVVLQNCTVSNNLCSNTITGFDFVSAIVTPTLVSNIILRNCSFTNNSGVNGCIGFNFANTTTLAVLNCQAINNTASAGVATGFNIGATGNGVSSILFNKCTAAYNNGSTDANSFGFRNQVSTNPAFISCVGLRNGPITPAVANQLSGVPASSVTASTITTLNGVSQGYFDVGIT